MSDSQAEHCRRQQSRAVITGSSCGRSSPGGGLRGQAIAIGSGQLLSGNVAAKGPRYAKVRGILPCNDSDETLLGMVIAALRGGRGSAGCQLPDLGAHRLLAVGFTRHLPRGRSGVHSRISSYSTVSRNP